MREKRDKGLEKWGEGEIGGEETKRGEEGSKDDECEETKDGEGRK